MKRLGLAFFFFLYPLLSFAAADVILSGAGATFPSPLYDRWIEAYRSQGGSRIVYEGCGSGRGINLLLKQKTDFGATDIFLSDEEMRRSAADILHIPTCVGAVAIIYNLPGAPRLRFTPDLLVDIFLGRITRWSDRRIAWFNPDIALPELEIAVVHRSEKSGTTFLLTDYLSKVSPGWKKSIGSGLVVRWPAGLGVEENSGVADLVQRVPGSIGYVSLNYAKARGLPVAAIRNHAGQFVYPTEDALSLAATVDIPQDTRILITNSRAPRGYPISAFTYLIFYREQAYNHRSKNKALALAHFLWWCIHEGQRYTKPLYYAPLPQDVVARSEKIIRSVTYQGKPLF